MSLNSIPTRSTLLLKPTIMCQHLSTNAKSPERGRIAPARLEGSRRWWSNKVGLGVVLDTKCKCVGNGLKKHVSSAVVVVAGGTGFGPEFGFHLDKDVMSEFQVSRFLRCCYLCRKNLAGKDIYMYREKAFCSPKCRYQLIEIEEYEESPELEV